jgi:enoyl-CoA hydratase/carnithine racemase
MPAPPLAHAFLALADDDSEPRRRSLPVAIVAAVAAVALALGAPLAWLADHPVAALGAKGAAALLDDEAPA